MKRGAFIVFEGLDRSGKTTQVNLLNSFLKSKHIPYSHIRFPDRTTETGKLIDAYLTKRLPLEHEVIHNLFAQNRREKMDTMKELLKEGQVIICDRYAYSGVAYSSAKGLDIEWCKEADRGILKPDLVIFLNINLENNSSREGYGDEIYEKLEFQYKVKEVYDTLWDDNWISINANQTIESVQADIQREVSALLDKSLPSEPNLLWTINSS